jgi:uncharacterized membrane protein
MDWNRRYSLMSYVRSSLWVVPFLALMVEKALKPLAEQLGTWMVAQGYYNLKTGFLALGHTEAIATLDRLFTLSLSSIVFTFGSLLVAIQVAGGQYTPRIIATTLLRDNVIRWIVGLFIFTLLWANQTLNQLGRMADVPQFQVYIGSVLGLASLIAFLVLIDYCAKLLRPVSLVRRIAEEGITVIKRIYPHPTQKVYDPAVPTNKRRNRVFGLLGSLSVVADGAPVVKRGQPDRVIYRQGRSAIVLAVNLQKLMATALKFDTTIEFVHQIGDFVAVDEPLFYLYGGDVNAIDGRKLSTLVAFGSERTIDQDPMFAFRIEVDIALKALSPAINDPTTAVLAIDQLHRLLRQVGGRSLHGQEIIDAEGLTRVVFRTPDWEDYVHVTFREIRYCGANSLQVVRRLRSMIDNLLESLPEHRHPVLREELELLDRAIKKNHEFPEDLALARIADSQGLGGSSGAADDN